jgi:hypothetical protein
VTRFQIVLNFFSSAAGKFNLKKKRGKTKRKSLYRHEIFFFGRGDEDEKKGKIYKISKICSDIINQVVVVVEFRREEFFFESKKKG